MSQGNSRGFTLIELMLSMAFISILLISIALLVLQISNIYNRGITLREVDTTGRVIAEQFRRDISQQASFEISNINYFDYGIGGRLCTGYYSYVWNYAKAIEDGSSSLNKYETSISDVIKLIKINDPANDACKTSLAGVLPDITYNNSIVNLIPVSSNLALYEFNISKLTSDDITKESLYKISYTIGTNEQALIDNNQCRPPSDVSARDFSYCSINNFDIIVKAGSAK